MVELSGLDTLWLGDLLGVLLQVGFHDVGFGAGCRFTGTAG